MNKRIIALFAISSIAGSAHAEQLKLSTIFNGSPAELIADGSKFAGAVYSFTWDGTQYIDATDHGRLLQSAASFDGLGECYNPTEAGSADDGNKSTSTSRVLKAIVHNETLETSVGAAFWTAPGVRKKICGTRKDVTHAVNTSFSSSYLITKKVRFGHRNIENVLTWDVSFNVPSPHATADFEVLTGYMPFTFRNVSEFAAARDEFITLPFETSDRARPLVISNDAGKSLGILCPSPRPVRYQFMRFDRQKVVKWNCLVRSSDIPAGDQNFRAYLFFGNKDDVKKSMREKVSLKQ